MEANRFLLLLILICALFMTTNIIIDNKTENDVNQELAKVLFAEPARVDTVRGPNQNIYMSAESQDIASYWHKQSSDFRGLIDNSIDTLTLDIHINYFTNSETMPIKLESLEKSIRVQEKVMQNAGLKIKFDFVSNNIILGSPEENKEVVPKYINQDDLTTYNYSANYWSLKYKVDNALNINIFNTGKMFPEGNSLTIPSQVIKVSLSAMDPKMNTIIHEIGHALGLRHPHELDNGNNDYTTGDKVSSTAICPPLAYLIDENCDLREDYKSIRKALEASEKIKSNSVEYLDNLTKEELDKLRFNIMSYTYKVCRTSYEPEQLSVIDFTLKTNQDIRNMFPELRGDKIIELYVKENM